MNLSEWLTLATLVATLGTLYFVLVAEKRFRRQFRRADFVIDHVGPANGGELEVFEITNCGTEMATKINMIATGWWSGTGDVIRPILTLKPGESKQFIAKLIEDIDTCWVQLSWYSASDYRFNHVEWHPLKRLGQLDEQLLESMSTPGMKDRLILVWRRLTRVVEPVGPGRAPYTRVRSWKGERTRREFDIANGPALEWLSARIEEQERGTSHISHEISAN